MKNIFLVTLLLNSVVGFTQITDCSKFKVKNIYIVDSVASITVHYSGNKDQFINYSHVSNFIEVNNKTTNGLIYDTLNSKIGDMTNGQFGESDATYKIKLSKLTNSYNTEYKVNFSYNHIDLGSIKHTCTLDYQEKDTLICNYLKLINDTVTVDFEKNKTNLKFTYMSKPFSYPNYQYETEDTVILNVNPKSKNQTYGLSNDQYCFEYSCTYYSPMEFGMKFSTQSKEETYLKGKFTIGRFNINYCKYDIVFKIKPASLLSTFDSDINTFTIYPIPFSNELFIENCDNEPFEIRNLNGIVVIKGLLKNNRINTEMLNSGIYYLLINGKNSKISKL